MFCLRRHRLSPRRHTTSAGCRQRPPGMRERQIDDLLESPFERKSIVRASWSMDDDLARRAFQTGAFHPNGVRLSVAGASAQARDERRHDAVGQVGERRHAVLAMLDRRGDVVVAELLKELGFRDVRSLNHSALRTIAVSFGTVATHAVLAPGKLGELAGVVFFRLGLLTNLVRIRLRFLLVVVGGLPLPNRTWVGRAGDEDEQRNRE